MKERIKEAIEIIIGFLTLATIIYLFYRFFPDCFIFMSWFQG